MTLKTFSESRFWFTSYVDFFLHPVRLGHRENRPMTKDLKVFLELMVCIKKKLPTEAIQQL